MIASSPRYREWMERARAGSRLCEPSRDVPVGAVIVDEAGTVIAEGHNTRERDQDPTGHAEIAVLRAAAAVCGDWQLGGLTLVVTLEPCLMCAGAIQAARIARVVFGAWELKYGAAGSSYDLLRDPRLPHTVEVISGVLEVECADDLRAFFRNFR